MGKIVTVKVVADTSDAIQDIDQVSDSLKQLDSQSKKATDSQEGLTDQVTKNGGAMALLNTLTGGVAQQFKDAYEASALFTQGLKGMTLAQIRLNVAMAINPLTVAATGVLALGAAIVQYGSSITDGVVSRTETFMNLIKSIGNPLGFAARQAESYAKGLVAIKDAQDELQLDRSIKVLQAFGKSTIDLEIDLAQRKLKALKEGEEGYDEAYTNLLVLRARRAKELQDKEQLELETRRREREKQIIAQRAELARTDGVPLQEAQRIQFEQYIDLAEEYANEEVEISLDANRRIIEANKERALLLEDIERRVVQSKFTALNDIMSIANQESALYKAAYIARQILVLQQIKLDFLDLKSKAAKATAEASLNSAVASTEIAKGSAKAVGTLNPLVIAAYAISAAAVVASMVQAVRGVKKAASPYGGGGATPSISAPNTTASPTPPDFNVVGTSGVNQIADAIAGQQTRPVRAYVVASDVSTAQSLERNIVKGASI
jgi:hypothetical protein